MPALAFSLDSTYQQVLADLLVIALVGLNTYLGWKNGLMRRLFTFILLYAAIGGATYVGNPLAGVVDAHSLAANAWMFLLLFAGLTLLFEVLGSLLDEKLQSMIAESLNRVVGTIAGLALGIAECSIVFMVAAAVGNQPLNSPSYPVPKTAVSSASLGEYIVDVAPIVKDTFAAVLPNDMAQHFAEGVQH